MTIGILHLSFCFVCQKDIYMATPRKPRRSDILTTNSFFREESSIEYPEVYLPDFIEEIIKKNPLKWENIYIKI